MDRIVDYASLAAGIQELVNLEIGDSVDAFIQLTEQDMGRQFETLWQESAETLAVLRAGIYFADDRRGILRVTIDGRPLERLHIDEARTTYRDWTPQRPMAYTVTGGNSETMTTGTQHVQFWPPPPDDTSYQALITYKIVIPALTDINTTNWVMSVAPDAYLYGAASHAVIYNGDETSLALYERKYDRGVAGVIAEVERHQSMQKTVSPPGAGGYERWLP